MENNFVESKKTILKIMSDFEKSWTICGGWAIDLFLGKQTREHKDIDLFIWRSEQLYAQQYFQERGWYLQKATEGQLIDWQEGEFLELPIHGIWCKHSSHEPDFIELLLNESDETHFLFRRDRSIRRLKGELIHFSEEKSYPRRLAATHQRDENKKRCRRACYFSGIENPKES